MKIFMINSVCGIRSTGRICTDIGTQLLACGNDCRIAYGRESAPDPYLSVSYRIGSKLDVNIHCLLTRLFDCTGFGSIAATRRLIKAIKDYDPDIIHLHNIHGYYLNIDILFNYLRTSNKPIVWTLHDCWSFTGHCSYFTLANCDKWTTICGHCPQKKEYPASYLLDRSRSNYLYKKRAFTNIPNLILVSPSQWLATLVGRSFLADYPIKVIPNGIDIQSFQHTTGSIRQLYHIDYRKIVLGVASIWNARKGLDDFIKLSELLSSEYVVVLVGLSPQQIAKLPSKIIGISRTNNVQELAELYSAATVFVNPTYEDNYPTVNLEAQACGTPILTYRTGGSVESVSPDCVVEPGDIHTLAKKIRTGDFHCRTDLPLDRTIMLNKYIELYHELLKSNNTLDIKQEISP